MNRVLVTGATGKTGTALIDALLGRGIGVRALVRRSDGRAAALQRRGIETCVGDLTDVGTMTRALDGVDSVYLVPPFMPEAYRPAEALAGALRTVGTRHVVLLTQWLASAHHPSPMTRDCWRSEVVLTEATDGRLTVIEPGMFADNFLKGLLWAKASGLFLHAMVGGRSAPVAQEDIAAVVAEVLRSPEEHEGQRYRPSGPTLLDADAMGRAVGRAIGRRILSVRTPWWIFERSAFALGVSSQEIANFRLYREEHARGTFEIGHDGGRIIEQLAGRPAESFESIAARSMETLASTLSSRERLRQLAILGYSPFARSAGLSFAKELSDASRLWANQDVEWRGRHAESFA